MSELREILVYALETVIKNDATDPVDGTHHISAEAVLELINGIPNDDIIYCKDCKRRRTDGYCTRFQVNINGIATHFFMPEEDDFCSRAERRINE